MLVYAIRHGESEYNVDKMYTGWAPTPLTPLGREEAVRAGRLLQGVPIDRIYASDLLRAVETAQLAIPGCEMRLREELRENSVGSLAGIPAPDFAREHPQASAAVRSDLNFRPYGGESQEDMFLRVSAFMRELEREDCEHAVVFCHGGTICHMLGHVLGVQLQQRRLHIDNGSVTVFSYNGGWRLVQFNVTSGALKV